MNTTDKNAHIDFRSYFNSIDRTVETKILEMMDGHKDSYVEIPGIEVSLRHVPRKAAIKRIEYRSHSDRDFECDYLALMDESGRTYSVSDISNGELSAVYDYVWAYYQKIDNDTVEMKYRATLKWLKEMDLDKLVEWINNHLCAEILPNNNEEVWREYESRLKSMDRFVECLCDSLLSESYSRNDRYVSLSDIKFLESYGSVEKVWNDFGNDIEAFLRTQ